MKKITLLIGIGLFLFSSVTGVMADTVINGGFETGDLTGWTANYPSLSSVQNDYLATAPPTVPSDVIHYYPKEEAYLAKLTANPDSNNYVTISQNVFMNAGSTISGWAAFQARDLYSLGTYQGAPYLRNDDAYVRILLNGLQIGDYLWYEDVLNVGNYKSSDWTEWSWTATESGTYTIEFGVRNGVYGVPSLPVGTNAIYNSVALFDGVHNNSSVPEPGTMLLLGAGLVGILGYGRKRVF